MRLPVPSQVGPFQIIALLGTGGMGEVYRARDTRLRRDVAVKIVAERYATDAARIHRFLQEAQAAGQLKHPNVLSVYDVGVHDGAPYIVSELLEGESLQQRMARRPIAPARAIHYARQIADGLAAAHAKGVVHRDVKPANIFIGGDDHVTILDFGIAKLLDVTDNGVSAAADTAEGIVIGTVDYMSPEQVRGETIDGRSDLFSLGIVLHEMLTGAAPFRRATAADTAAAILKDDPTPALPPQLSPALNRVIERCLDKNRDTRFQSARDLAFGLALASGSDIRSKPSAPPGFWMRGVMLPATVGITVTALLATLVWLRAPRSANQSVSPMRLSVALGTTAPIGTLARQYGNAVAISPDGRFIAFIAQPHPDGAPQLYVRRLGETASNALPGTEGANAPFFSRDSRWIAFEGGRQLRKIAVSGGAPIVLTPAESPRGGAWTADGSLVLAPDRTPGVRLERVPASGGATTPVTTLTDGEVIHAWPNVLPEDRAVLYTSSRVAGAFNDANLVVQPLPTGTPKVVQRGAYHGVYVRSGHILFVHDGALFALPFDPARLEATGPPVRVLSGLGSNGLTGGAQFSISDAGTLVYLSGPSVGAGEPLELLDRAGVKTMLRSTPANWSTPAFAPDGLRLAVGVHQGPLASGDIWISESGREPMTQLTSDPALDQAPVWSADGQRVTFASNRDGPTPNLYWQRADGKGTAERLTTSTNEQIPGSWHPSGRFLAFEEMHAATLRDVMILPMEGDETSGWRPGVPFPFVQSAAMEWSPRFSPDGHWIAFSSSESGHREVYVRPFPGPGPAVRVSSTGGEMAVWSHKRHEIIYGYEGQLLVAPYTVEGSRFTVEPSHQWPNGHYQTRGRTRMFDLRPDDDHVVLALDRRQPANDEPAAASFVFNFFDDLQRLAPPIR